MATDSIEIVTPAPLSTSSGASPSSPGAPTNPFGSTGPRTAAGKAIASRNATRHGITSATPVVRGVELPEDWHAHRHGILHALNPASHFEETLAERAALLLWRLRRIDRYEAESISLGHESAEEDAAATLARLFSFRPSASDRYDRPGDDDDDDGDNDDDADEEDDGGSDNESEDGASTRIADLFHDPDALRQEHASLAHAVAVLESLPYTPEDHVYPLDHVIATLRAVARATTAGTRRAGRAPGSYRPHGARRSHGPDGLHGPHGRNNPHGEDLLARALQDSLGTATQWHPAHLRRALDLLAGPAGNLHLLIPRALRAARQELQDAATALARLERATLNLQRQRLLPDPPTLDRVIRYEAHLSRLLTSTLHELEAHQRRRQGDPAPLARLDISSPMPESAPQP